MPDEAFDPRIDTYIEEAAPFAQPILTHLRKLMHQACPRMNEAIKWRLPFFVQEGIVLAHMAAFKHHCVFGFWGPQMKKLLEKRKRPARSSGAFGQLNHITSLKDLPDDQTLLAYMCQAAELVESGERTKSIERPKKTAAARPVKIPAELTAALKKSKAASKAFELFAPSHRREYAMWIDQAKRPETKQKRIAQAIVWIAQGKSRHWKYQVES